MFQFPPCPPSGLYIQPAVPGYCPGGFPHSGIPGSKLDDSSPRLIAAIHALHRLLAPRHPPYALSSLIHVRRQHLIRVDTSSFSAQLLRCQPKPGHACAKLASDESLAGVSENPRPHRAATHLSSSRHKSARHLARHRFCVPTISQLL